MPRTLAAAALLAATAALPMPAASAYCEVPLGSTCLVQSVCGTATKPVHDVDDALGRPLSGFPHCVD
jgi:hypothetical protein